MASDPDTPESAPTAAGSAPPATTTAPRKRRRVLLIVLIVAAFLAVLGGTIGVVVYDRATAIDRTTPEVAAAQFLNAALKTRSESEVSLYICSTWSASAAMKAAELPAVPNLIVTWGDTQVTRNGSTAIADVRVTLALPTGSGSLAYRDIQPWQLTMSDEDGWRVCGLTRGPSIN